MQAIVLLVLIFTQLAFAQEEKGATVQDVQRMINETLASKWYERIQLRGYADFRYNRIGETNNKLTCNLCDQSVGDKQGFFMRRARLVFFGDVNDRVYIYIQPDYSTNASAANGTQMNYLQIRDAYFDYHLTEDKEWRLRTGIQKVIFGYETMTSSANRAAFDRSDAINSAAPNERDTGLALMYAPTEIRKRFKELANATYKGTGDYGAFAVSAYNGQSLNRTEKNNDLHRAVRVTYPFKLKSGQFIEASLQAYEGKYNTADQGLNKNFYDARQAATLVYFPQPFGFQAEYNVGQGPEYDASQNKIRVRNLKGGYALLNYAYFHKTVRYAPYIRYQEYHGGYKLQTNAQSGRMHEWEVGTEWQPHAAFEMTVAYGMQDRLNQSSLTNRSHQKGNLVRLQAQFNY
jgi:Phosphate-selective porin O and P